MKKNIANMTNYQQQNPGNIGNGILSISPLPERLDGGNGSVLKDSDHTVKGSLPIRAPDTTGGTNKVSTKKRTGRWVNPVRRTHARQGHSYRYWSDVKRPGIPGVRVGANMLWAPLQSYVSSSLSYDENRADFEEDLLEEVLSILLEGDTPEGVSAAVRDSYLEEWKGEHEFEKMHRWTHMCQVLGYPQLESLNRLRLIPREQAINGSNGSATDSDDVVVRPQLARQTSSGSGGGRVTVPEPQLDVVEITDSQLHMLEELDVNDSSSESDSEGVEATVPIEVSYHCAEDVYTVEDKFMATFTEDTMWPKEIMNASLELCRLPTIVFNPTPRTWVAVWSKGYDVQLSRGDDGWKWAEHVPRSDPHRRKPSFAIVRAGFEANTRKRLTRGTRGGLDSALNGANGEVTGKDDVKIKGQQQPKKKTKGLRKTEKAALKNMAITYGGKAASAAATMLGVPALAAPARQLGEIGGAWASRLAGWGMTSVKDLQKHNYKTVKKNAILNGNMSSNATFGGDVMRVTMREKVCNVYTHALSAGSAVIYAFPIQPAYSNLYRKSASLALNFAEWCPMGIVFEFISSMGDYSATGPIGSVTMGFQFNPNAPAPTSSESMENLDMVMNFKLTDNAGYAIECAPDGRTRPCYYTRIANASSGLSAVDYDYGTMYLCVEAPSTIAVSTLLGKLYVTWDIKYLKSTLTTYRPGYHRFVRNGISNTLPFGTTTLTDVGYGSCTNFTLSGTQLQFIGAAEQTSYSVELNYYGSSATITAPTPTLTNLTGLTMIANSTASVYQFPADGVASVRFAYRFAVTVNCGLNATAILQLGTSGSLPASPTMDIIIQSLGSSLVVGSNI